MAANKRNNLFTHYFFTISVVSTLLPITSCSVTPPPDNYHKGWFFVTQAKEHLQFKYKSTVIGVADKQKFKNIGINMILPLNLLRNTITDNSFTFYYPEKQVIFIKANSSNSYAYRDTLYLADSTMTENYIDKNVPYFPENQDLFNSKFLNNRKNIIIHKKMFTILLYNIKEETFISFKNSALSVRNY